MAGFMAEAQIGIIRTAEVNMQVTVDLIGIAQSLAHERQISVALPEGSDYNAVVHALAERYPQFKGILIDLAGESLLNANVFSRNGEDILMPGEMDGHPQDGEHLLLLSIIVGGSNIR
jgi:hypothetical protein